jgi:hypothetical protein
MNRIKSLSSKMTARRFMFPPSNSAESVELIDHPGRMSLNAFDADEVTADVQAVSATLRCRKYLEWRGAVQLSPSAPELLTV